MTDKLADKLKQLPAQPGVYFHKDTKGEIIYVGKAASLRNRVRQYFQASRHRDPKTEVLVAEIADTDWVVVENELDALFLEAEMVRRYMPRYNILLRDDKSSLFVRIAYDAAHPTLTFTRRPLDDKARYFGPYFNGSEVKRALRSLRRVFPYSTHTGIIPKRACLQYHLGLCPGLEENKTSLQDYRANLRKLMQYLKGERVKVLEKMEHDMQRAAKKKEFERAADIRNQYYALKALSKQIIFSDREFLDISKDRGLQGLADLLGLPKVPRRIEGYDISHMQGTDNVASMVVFTNGIPDKAAYRKFKMRLPGNNDFGHMEEVITRRLGEKNQKDWGLPDLFLIDGGKGQLTAAIKARDAAGTTRPMIGLAKREEEIVVHKTKSLPAVGALFDAPDSPDRSRAVNSLASPVTHSSQSDGSRQGISGSASVGSGEFGSVERAASGAYIMESDDFKLILLSKNSDIVKLLQRVRDESHRFAVSYHSVLKTKRQTASALDDIPGIGPATRKKLIRTFGSLRAVEAASPAELAAVIGPAKAKLLVKNNTKF
ncbi:MAG TPA: excinuclease ABC subunit UvrC [Nevskiaceae bacterium]|nr:excinuclease ABC subunit UvrC [Nevskiaceae bacterium]